MRLFIAVELTEEARREVAAVQTELRRIGTDVKWVEPENLHLTLKFLGEVDESRLSTLTQALREAVGDSRPFTISLEGVGAFPSPERLRVIWVGIKKGREPLTALAAHIEEACVRLEFPAEGRPFSPHLTIGRVHSGKQLHTLAKSPVTTPFKTSEPIHLDRLVLFQSKLSPRGSTYIPLAEIPFKH